MKKVFKFSILLFLIFSSTLSWCAPAIIWDLGGVLLKQNKFKMIYHEVGLKSILWYTVRDFQNPTKIQRRIFQILYHLGKQQTNNPSFYPEIGELPQIMCDWLEGKVDAKTIIKIVNAAIEELDKQDFFVSDREKNLLKKMMSVMFNPVIMAKYTKPVTQSCSLLNAIAQSGCEQYILSNWYPESFNELYASEHGQKIFKYFKPENIIISGKCGIMKPKKEIFQFLLEKYQLNPAECIFIDDQQENIKTAHEIGMQTILFKDISFDDVRMQLQQKGFLNNNLKIAEVS